MNKFLKEFKDRGFFYQCTGEENLSQLLDKEKIRAYIGFDCTAESLHVGSLLQIMCLRLLQKHGHQPIVLLGGGTTRIGDPSGKDKTRKILSEEEIEKNINNIEKILKNFLDDKDPKTKPIFVNNYTWLKNLNYISFLRDVGKHFTINKMLSFDSVKIRLEREQSLSYMEFNYMILQAYGLTTPLITLASGAKMGKTESGAVWLDKKFLSPYDYWQFWRNIDDNDVLKFIKIFTDIDMDQIEKIKNDNINELKILLANKATEMLHGERESKNSEETAKKTFTDNSMGGNLPSISISEKELMEKMTIINLIILSKLENSKSEVRRLIKGNGIRINNQVITDEKFIVTKDLFQNNLIKLSLGKKKHIKVELN